MKISLVLACLLAAALLTPAATFAAPARHRLCGTRSPAPAEAAQVRGAIQQFDARAGVSRRTVTIPGAFHVITCSGVGNVPASQIDAQIRGLNAAYRGSGFSFTLASVDRTEDCRWFSDAFTLGVERKMKRALAIDPAHRLNLYTTNPSGGILGWAYFPQSFAEDSYMHGVVILYSTLPGGEAAPYDLGGTADHEVGHYLGLFHTFENGCSSPGDDVDDTPFEASAAFGCPAGRNTCPAPGDDPIHNYMDYTDDACYTEFTTGQVSRMQSIVAVYRPSLFGRAIASQGPALETPLAARAGGVELRGAFPNPVARESALRWALPAAGHVSLALYNVAGQRVRTLVDGECQAGEHVVMLSRGALPPGMYFVALSAAGQRVSRSVLLAP